MDTQQNPEDMERKISGARSAENRELQAERWKDAMEGHASPDADWSSLAEMAAGGMTVPTGEGEVQVEKVVEKHNIAPSSAFLEEADAMRKDEAAAAAAKEGTVIDESAKKETMTEEERKAAHDALLAAIGSSEGEGTDYIEEREEAAKEAGEHTSYDPDEVITKVPKWATASGSLDKAPTQESLESALFASVVDDDTDKQKSGDADDMEFSQSAIDSQIDEFLNPDKKKITIGEASGLEYMTMAAKQAEEEAIAHRKQLEREHEDEVEARPVIISTADTLGEEAREEDLALTQSGGAVGEAINQQIADSGTKVDLDAVNTSVIETHGTGAIDRSYEDNKRTIENDAATVGSETENHAQNAYEAGKAASIAALKAEKDAVDAVLETGSGTGDDGLEMAAVEAEVAQAETLADEANSEAAATNNEAAAALGRNLAGEAKAKTAEVKASLDQAKQATEAAETAEAEAEAAEAANEVTGGDDTSGDKPADKPKKHDDAAKPSETTKAAKKSDSEDSGEHIGDETSVGKIVDGAIEDFAKGGDTTTDGKAAKKAIDADGGERPASIKEAAAKVEADAAKKKAEAEDREEAAEAEDGEQPDDTETPDQTDGETNDHE